MFMPRNSDEIRIPFFKQPVFHGKSRAGVFFRPWRNFFQKCVKKMQWFSHPREKTCTPLSCLTAKGSLKKEKTSQFWQFHLPTIIFFFRHCRMFYFFQGERNIQKKSLFQQTFMHFLFKSPDFNVRMFVKLHPMFFACCFRKKKNKKNISFCITPNLVVFLTFFRHC